MKDIAQNQEKRKKCAARMDDHLPLLAFQYHSTGRCDLGRPERRCKENFHLQSEAERALVNLGVKDS
jgi:hypothetical protein